MVKIIKKEFNKTFYNEYFINRCNMLLCRGQIDDLSSPKSGFETASFTQNSCFIIYIYRYIYQGCPLLLASWGLQFHEK